MRAQRLIVAAAVVACLTGSGYSDSYQFSNGGGRFTFQFYAYVNGTPIDNWNYMRVDPSASSTLSANVDPDALDVTFDHALVQQSSPLDVSGIAKEPGFGGHTFPFTLHLTSSFQTDVARAPYAINSATLAFDTSLTNGGQPSGVLDYTGYVDINGTHNALTSTVPMAVYEVGTALSHFDDSGYPDTLNMTLSGLWWEVQSPRTIFQKSIGASTFEIQMTRATVFATGHYDGILVPEPATLSLLALGGLGVLRKRRK